MGFSFIPPGQIKVGSPVLYIGLLVVLTLLLVAVPFLVFHLKKAKWRDPNSDFAPFTWEAESAHPSKVTQSAKVPAEVQKASDKEPAHAGK